MAPLFDIAGDKSDKDQNSLVGAISGQFINSVDGAVPTVGEMAGRPRQSRQRKLQAAVLTENHMEEIK